MFLCKDSSGGVCIYSRVTGFTLIEFMISTLISVILIASVFSFFGQTLVAVNQYIVRRQNQNQILSVLFRLEGEMGRADAFGGHSPSNQREEIAGIRGDAHRLALMFHPAPCSSVLMLHADRQTIVVEPGYQFKKNQKVFLSGPDHFFITTVEFAYQNKLNEVVKLDEKLPEMNLMYFVIAPLALHTYFLDSKRHALLESEDGRSVQSLLDQVESFDLLYDVKTKSDVIEKTSLTEADQANVLGVKIKLRVNHDLYVSYAPLWSHQA